MSAFMVPATHIHALLTAGLTWTSPAPLAWYDSPAPAEAYQAGKPWGPGWRDWAAAHTYRLTERTAGRVGAMLLAANRRSVTYPYVRPDGEAPYRFTRLPGTPEAATVINALACSVAQANEHPSGASPKPERSAYRSRSARSASSPATTTPGRSPTRHLRPHPRPLTDPPAQRPPRPAGKHTREGRPSALQEGRPDDATRPPRHPPRRPVPAAQTQEDAAASAQIGERLRGIRLQQNLSLQDVEGRSGGEIKASILGAYERGDRAISAPRLLRLAALYQIPASHLLPPAATHEQPAEGGRVEPMRVNLTVLAQRQEPEARALARYLQDIQRRRSDFNGRVLTLRGQDVRALAAALGRPADGLVTRLRHLGICGPAS